MGSLLSGRRQNNTAISSSPHKQNGKLDNVLDFIEDNYVDTINRKKLEESTLTSMLKQLDPHSDYIPAAKRYHLRCASYTRRAFRKTGCQSRRQNYQSRLKKSYRYKNHE